LELLGLLYGLFQKFIRFDEKFRETLWAEVELQAATHEVCQFILVLNQHPSHLNTPQVESFWDECLALPSKLKDWDAYTDMKNSIQEYRDVIPLLHKLASKVCLIVQYIIHLLFLVLVCMHVI
jgi:dynein heavy chain